MFEILASVSFLRPWWFLALLPVLWIIWQLWQTNKKQGAWHEVIEPKFQKLLLGESHSSEPSVNEKLGYISLAFLWLFAVIALAGPWIKSVEVPAQKSQQGIVIVLDLSLSMLADDVEPNRLARVKYTLTDLLKQHPENATGMVVYAGSAHSISPISEDNKTLLNLLPSLNPIVMPQFGSDPQAGLALAESLLEGGKVTHGHIIWITDDLETDQLESIDRWVSERDYTISLLTVGTEQGGVVQIPEYGLLKDDDDQLIMPSVPLSRFESLASDSQINWQHFQIGADHIEALLPQAITSEEEEATQFEQDIQHPLDFGIYFLFILVPLVAFIFRRGTLQIIAGISLLPLMMSHPSPAQADSLLNDLDVLFKSHDQLGYQAWEAEQYQKAEALFNDKQWRASTLYRQGKYAEAAELFQLDETASGFYNKGSALARQMKLDEAIEAYQQALKLEPNMSSAKDNLRIIQQLKQMNDDQKQDQPSQSQPQSPKSKGLQKESEDTSNEQQGSQSSQDSQKSESDNSKDQASKSGKTENANQQSASEKQNDSARQDEQDGSTQSKNQQNPGEESSGKQNNQKQPQKGDSGVMESSESGDETEASQNNEQNNKGARPNKLAESEPSSKSTTPQNQEGAPPMTEEEQAQLNWLKQIPDQPGLFLKRKFEYQYQQNPNKPDQMQKQW